MRAFDLENTQTNEEAEDDSQLVNPKQTSTRRRYSNIQVPSFYYRYDLQKYIKPVIIFISILILVLVVRSWIVDWRNRLEHERQEQIAEEKRIAKENRVKALTAEAYNNANFIKDDNDEIRTVVLYVYTERPDSRKNAVYFIQHGLHERADFIFIFNGESDLDSLFPKNAQNIRVIRRSNTCYDLGAVGEVLRSNDQEIVKRYNRFIFMNASVRGPFIPMWSSACWSDIFLNKLTEKVKLVGTTFNCWGAHIQSMVLATDLTGVKILLKGNETDTSAETDPLYKDWWGNPNSLVGLTGCYQDKFKAVSAELSVTHLIKKHGYNVTVLMSAFQADPNYEEHCKEGFEEQNKYNLAKVGPYELIFVKARPGWEGLFDQDLLDKMTEWHDSFPATSWEACRVKKVNGTG